MVAKINSYLLPSIVTDKMKVKIGETRERKIELGFGLCRLKNTNIIRPGDDCTGTECALTQVYECPTGTYIGGYHTHPHTGAQPSIADLTTAYTEEVECIGSVRDNNINCFIRDGPMDPQVKKEIIDAFETIEDPLGATISKEQYKKWIGTRDNILNKYFKIVEIR